MRNLTTMLMVFGLSTLLADAAVAWDTCESELARAQAALAHFEADGSDGKIEQCLPAKEPGKNTTAMLKLLPVAIESVANSEPKTAAFEARLNKLKDVLNQKSACRAGKQWLEDMHTLEAEVSQLSKAARKGFEIIEDARLNFDSQYAGRKAAGSIKVRPFRSVNCRKTEASIEKMQDVLYDAFRQCKKVSLPFQRAENLFEFWNEQLSSNCKIGQKCDVVSIGDGLYEVHHLDSDGEWDRYGRRDHYLSEAEKVKSECESRSQRIERTFPSDTEGGIVENVGDDSETGATQAK